MVNQYFVHILSLVTDNKPFLHQRKEENDHRNYFMINLYESMGLGCDRTRDPGSAVRRITNCTKIKTILANSADSDEMSHSLAFHLGLHCLRKYHFRVFKYIKGMELVALKPSAVTCK